MLDIALEHSHKTGKITSLPSLSFLFFSVDHDIQKSTTLLSISKNEPHVKRVGRLQPPCLGRNMHASRSHSVTQLLFADQMSCVVRGGDM